MTTRPTSSLLAPNEIVPVLPDSRISYRLDTASPPGSYVVVVEMTSRSGPATPESPPPRDS